MKTSNTNHHPDRGYLYERTQWDRLEAVLAGKWEARQRMRDGENLREIVGREVTLGERYTAASVIQWLGSNVGFGFITDAFSQAGYAVTGNCPSRPRPGEGPDALINAIQHALAAQEWEKRGAEACRQARQILFDAAEPS